MYMQGNFQGKTPLQLKAKKGDELSFLLQHKGFADREFVWTITRPEAKTVSLRKLFQLSLQSKPAGASVYLDEKLLGVTPHPIMLPEGQAVQIKLVLKGHITRKIFWKADRSEEKLIYLAPDVFDP